MVSLAAQSPLHVEHILNKILQQCYGVEDTLKALEASACDTLIVYENLEITRWVLKSSTGAEVVLHTNKDQLHGGDRSMFMDKETNQEMDIVDQGSFLEWLYALSYDTP